MELDSPRQDFAAAIIDFCRREAGTPEQRRGLTDNRRIAHNESLYRRLAQLGWIGVSIPEAYGGAGGTTVDTCILVEEVARGMLPIHGLGSSLIVAGPYIRFGTETQKNSMLSAIVAGDVMAIAMSEPGAGSDLGSMICSARREGDEYVVNGQKTWISDAHIAKRILLICRTDRVESRHRGLSMLEIPTGTPGVEIRQISTLGGENVNDVYFTDCRVPAANLLGEPNGAWGQLMSGLDAERVIIAAKSLGLARRTFDDLLAHVTERQQFGQPVGSFQALKHRIADLAVEIECCRLLVYDVASRIDDPVAGDAIPRQAAIAKLKCTEVTKRVALEGMQMMGGYGYATEHDMEGHVRESLAATIFGGTSEIQREIIGRSLGL
jgi:alkylation response protein AidB-like acyl-CoA dehydrogenase